MATKKVDPALVTPNPDELAHVPRSVPARGRRHRLWEDGDYCVFILATEGSNLPKGAMTKVPDSPHFESVKAAKRWINASGDLLAGKQIAIFRGYVIANVVAKTEVNIVLHEKPRIQVAGPKGEDAG